MRRIHTLVAALAIAAMLAPSASAGGGPLPYPHPRHADTVKATDSGSSWAVIAGTLAGVTVLLGAATVLPRRTRRLAVA